MKRAESITGRLRGRRAVGPGILLAGALILAPEAWGQAIHEILDGSVGGFPTDIFECGGPRKKADVCGLSYRYYCVDRPDEVNSPAAPPSGFATYRSKRELYTAEPVHTGNFPKASQLGPGRAWNLVWDAARDVDSPGHIGYYAAASQIVEHGELGNPLTLNCLPVTGQYACFGLITPQNSNAVRNSPLGDLQPLGALSPIPVPVVIQNGMDKISLVWEQAAGQVSRDGAPLPIQGYRLFVYPNPVNPPTEKELRDKAVPVGDVIPLGTTSLELDRNNPVLKGTVTLSGALRVVYTGGAESAYFSANGQATGLAFPDTAVTKEMDDAAAGAGGVARAIDIEDLYLEIRQQKGESDTDPGRSFLVVTVDLVGEPAGKLAEGTTVKVFIDFNDEGLAQVFSEPGKTGTEDITLQATLKQSGDGPVRAEFTGLPGMAAHSRVDSTHGQVRFVVPLDAVTGAVSNAKLQAADAGGGRRRILVWAETSRGNDTDRVPNTNDGKAPSVAGEVVKFTF